MPSIPKQKVFSALEVAKICGVVNQTVINWIRANHLKSSVTPGGQFRIYPDDLKEFLDSKNMRVPEQLVAILQEETPSLVIVEDDKVFNDLMKAQLVRAFDGVLIHQAFDGFQAGSMLVGLKPKVVLLDLNLPGVDGHELCRRIKNDPGFDKPLIIAMSATDDPTAESVILKEGADFYFKKPFDHELIVKTIQSKLKW